MKCLVTGGAGYIGSHVVINLIDAGHEVVVLDNLSTGHRAAVPAGIRFLRLDLSNTAEPTEAVAGENWDVVLHFAGISLVGDSMRRPFHYLRDNYITALNLIEACATHGVGRFVFSSTAVLFGGENQTGLITDNVPIEPGSP